ncbi:MAG: LysR family transcriptional regulator [Pseudomonadota bacterium]
MLSLKDLEFLTALARRKHFARAAEDCGVSQPAFSMRLRKIEEGLRVPVVKRGNRFEGFTPEGEVLLRHAHKIMDNLKSMEQDLRSTSGEITGNLSVGVIPTGVIFAAQAVKKLQQQHPGIKVSLQTATSLVVQQGVDNGQFDAGFTYGDGVSGALMRIEDVYHERYLLLAPKALLTGKKRSITWADAAELPLCLLEPKMQNRRIIDKVFSDAGLVPRVITESSGFLASIVLAAEGMAATIVPEGLAGIFRQINGIEARKMVEPELAMPVCLISRARDLGLPAVDALRSVCAEMR